MSSITILENTKHDDGYNVCKLLINHPENDEYKINALRYICCAEIPIYAFNRDNIDIIENTTKINTSILQMSLSQLPILNFNHDIHFLEDTYYNHNDDYEYDKHVLDTHDINWYINVKNETNETISFTTDDIIMNVNGKEIKTPFIDPVEICLLNPNENIKASMKATLSIGLMNGIHNASHTIAYPYMDDNPKASSTEYIFVIESSGQLDALDIFKRSCHILNMKYTHIKEVIVQHQKNKKNTSVISKFIFEHEKMQVLHPIVYYLRKHDEIVFASARNHSSLLKYQCCLSVNKNDFNKDCYDEINSSIDQCISYYGALQSLIML
jgi:hypothetical protein